MGQRQSLVLGQLVAVRLVFATGGETQSVLVPIRRMGTELQSKRTEQERAVLVRCTRVGRRTCSTSSARSSSRHLYTPGRATVLPRYRPSDVFTARGEDAESQQAQTPSPARTFRVEVVPLCRVRCLGCHWRFGTTSVAPNGNLGQRRTGILIKATHEREFLPNFGGHTASDRRGRALHSHAEVWCREAEARRKRYVKRRKGRFSVAWQ